MATPINNTISEDLGGNITDLVRYIIPLKLRMQFVQEALGAGINDFVRDSGGTKPYTKPVPQTTIEIAPMLYHPRR